MIALTTFMLFFYLSIPSQAWAEESCPTKMHNKLPEAKYDHQFEVKKVSTSIIHDYVFENFHNFTLIWLRSNYDGSGLPDETEVKSRSTFEVQIRENIYVKTSRDGAIQQRNQALKNIYSVYASQGPERSSQLDVYQAEDVKKADRTYHLTVTSAQSETIAHMQYQTSAQANETLNLEDHFKEEKNFIRGKNPDQPTIEIGRLEILEQAEAKNAINKKILGERNTRNFIFYSLWSETLLEIVAKHPNDPVVFQANTNTLEKLEQYFFQPFEFKTKQKVTLSPDLPQEWLVKMSPEEVKTLAKLALQKKLIGLFEEYLNSKFKRDLASIFLFTVSPNAFDVLEELGVHAEYLNSYRRQQVLFWERRGFSKQVSEQRALERFPENTPIDRKAASGEGTIGLGTVETRALLEQWKVTSPGPTIRP